MSDVIDDDLMPIERPGVDTLPPSLREIGAFGTNPGNLKMRLFEPGGSLRRRPLVVVLHGCAQTASGYDLGSGWSKLAAENQFLVLYPEQQRANNEHVCFSWFDPSRTRRGAGEVESIRQMIATTIDEFEADPARVFICGLSAGGAMAGAMLAGYPELFRGGAILAGLPHGTAASVTDAYESMSSGRIKDARTWGDLVRAARGEPWTGRWPSIAIWHGTADPIVKPINAGELVKQWTNVHGIGGSVPAEDKIGRVTRRAWRDWKGRERVVEYSVPNLGHGAPIDGTVPPAPFFLPAGIPSTRQIARDWGLTDSTRPRTLLSRLGF